MYGKHTHKFYFKLSEISSNKQDDIIKYTDVNMIPGKISSALQSKFIVSSGYSGGANSRIFLKMRE